MSVVPGQRIAVVLQNAPSGLTTVGMRIDNDDGTERVARVVVAELLDGSGVYAAEITAPIEIGEYLVAWDTGGLSPIYSSEDLVVDADAPAGEEPGAAFTPTLQGAPTGQAGSIGVQLLDASGAEVIARTTAGITELDPGVYSASLTAPSDPGAYVVVWDLDGEYAAEPITVGALVAWEPTVADVGRLLRARTKDRSGEELGTFTTETRPTAAQVEGLIVQAVVAVRARVGTLSPSLEDRAGHLAALYAAMLVELSYFPEQTEGDDTVYARLKELYDEGMATLLEADADGSTESKGFYSIPMRSEMLPEVLP